jgi:hypothetical protein
MLGKINSDLIMLCQVISGYIMLGHVKAGFVRLVQVYIKLCHVISG